MKVCPHCGKKWSSLPFQTSRWFENGFGNHCLTVTECCNRPVTIYMRRVYDITPYTGESTEDEWGREFKRVK